MMKQRRVTEYALYRRRYLIGYVLGLAVITTLIIFAAFYVPGGLREAERTTAVASANLEFAQFDPSTVINLPYNLLQRASFEIFGITTLSIKLPSIILGLLAVIGFFYLIKEWFKKNVAMITTVTAATMPLFVFMSQDGTAAIYVVTVATWLLVAATHASRRHSPRLLWKIVLFMLLALNLYTPLGIYLNLAIVTTVIFHPHIRFLIRRLNPNYIVTAGFVSLLLLAPLIYSLVAKPSIAVELLGLPQETPDVLNNIKTMFLTYVGIIPSESTFVQPILSLGLVLLVTIGIYRFIQTKHTARSYILWFWMMTLGPLILINPDHITYAVPVIVIMVAMGITTLISEWYRLFPLNPYARVIGLLPLSIIVIGLVSSNASRYMVSYHYAPSLVRNFNQDLRLLNETLTITKASKDEPIQLILSKNQIGFYQTVARYDQRFEVKAVSQEEQLTTPYIISHLAWRTVPVVTAPNYIATDAKSQAADRFYLYTSDEK